MYITRICSDDFLQEVAAAVDTADFSKIKEIRVCIPCYKRLKDAKGHQWRRTQVYVLQTAGGEKSAGQADSQAAASTPALRLIPPGTSERFPTSALRYAFSLPDADKADWPVSEAVAKQALPMEREAHSMANATLFATFARPDSSSTGPTYQDLQNIANFVLGCSEHRCAGCNEVAACVLLRRSLSSRNTLTPTLALACGACGYIIGGRFVRGGHTGKKGLRLSAQTANSVALATNSMNAARKILSAVGTACPSKSTLHRAATRVGVSAADKAHRVAAERVLTLAAYLDELGLNEAVPDNLTDQEALDILAKTPIYIAVDGTYSSIARNNAAWSAVAFFVVSTKTAVSTPLLTLARRAGHIAGQVPKQYESGSTTKGLERLLVQEGIEFFRENGLRGVPLIVADQDAGVASELQKFSWVVGTDKNHYFLSFTRQIVDLQRRMTTETIGNTGIAKLSVVSEVRQYMQAASLPAAASSSAAESTTDCDASTFSDSMSPSLLDCSEAKVGLGVSLSELAETDERVHQDTHEGCWGVPLLMDLEHVNADGKGKLDPVRDAAAEHHARLALRASTVDPVSEVLLGAQCQQGTIPPAKVVAYLKAKLVSIVYQSAKMAGGRAHRMRELLSIAIEHYSGNHQHCRTLFPGRGACNIKTYVFEKDGAFLSFLVHLFSEYFGTGEEVSMGALCMTMVMSTNCCEAFNSKIRTYAPKKDALTANWYQIIHKTFLDMTCGRSAWRKFVHDDVGSSHLSSAATFYHSADSQTVQAQNRVRSGIESAEKVQRTAKRRQRMADSAASGAGDYTSHTDLPLPGLSAAARRKGELASQIAQEGNLSELALSQRSELPLAASQLLLPGKKKKAAAPRASKKRPAPSSAPSTPMYAESSTGSDTTTDCSLSLGGDSSSVEESDSSDYLSMEAGAANGWRAGCIRFVANVDGHDWFTKEGFVQGAWRQFYFEAKSGRLDRGEDGQVAFTSARHATSDDLDDDCELPAGVSALYSGQRGYTMAAAITPEDMDTYLG